MAKRRIVAGGSRYGSGVDCDGKQAFASAELALAVQQNMNRRDRSMAVYHCPHCRKFHIGGQKPKGMPPVERSRFQPWWLRYANRGDPEGDVAEA